MFEGLLPRSLDNGYRGDKLGLWLFGLLVPDEDRHRRELHRQRCRRDVHRRRNRAQHVPAAAAQNLVALWALIGLAHVVISLLCVLVLARYRSMVPLMFVLLLLQHLGGRLILQFHPLVRTGAPPASAVNLVFLAVMIVGLGLSLWRGR